MIFHDLGTYSLALGVVLFIDVVGGDDCAEAMGDEGKRAFFKI